MYRRLQIASNSSFQSVKQLDQFHEIPMPLVFYISICAFSIYRITKRFEMKNMRELLNCQGVATMSIQAFSFTFCSKVNRNYSLNAFFPRLFSFLFLFHACKKGDRFALARVTYFTIPLTDP